MLPARFARVSLVTTCLIVGCSARGSGGGGSVPDGASVDVPVTEVSPVDAPSPVDAAEAPDGGATRDAAPDDVGSTEAGAGDAGVVDAGSNDAAPSDVGSADAGPADATVACRSSRDCGATRQVCSPTAMVCVDCVVDVDCDVGQACNSDNRCVVRVCAPGTTECVSGTTARTCRPDGTGYVVIPCTPPNGASAQCTGGRCVTTCLGGRADCDGDPANGCESTLNTAMRCGSCSTTCAEPTPLCATSGGGFACTSGCSAGAPVRCGGACVDPSTDPNHCGRCGNACAATAQATSTCAGGACQAVCNAGFGNCDLVAANGCEVDLSNSSSHCGACNNRCAGGRSCVAGACSPDPPRSCLDIRRNDPAARSGAFTIDPDGPGSNMPFVVFCEFGLAAGGWTLVAAITTADTSNWLPTSPNWVNTATFGDPTIATGLRDAKSRAYSELVADELMIVRAGTPPVIEVQTTTGCMGARSLRDIMARNSSNDRTCAYSCTIVAVAAPWSGQTCQDSALRFRCRDAATSATVGGFTISTDDNSFITTLRNDASCTVNNFGLGAGRSSGYGDFDATTADSLASGDTRGRLLMVR